MTSRILFATPTHSHGYHFIQPTRQNGEASPLLVRAARRHPCSPKTLASTAADWIKWDQNGSWSPLFMQQSRPFSCSLTSTFSGTGLFDGGMATRHDSFFADGEQNRLNKNDPYRKNWTMTLHQTTKSVAITQRMATRGKRLNHCANTDQSRLLHQQQESHGGRDNQKAIGDHTPSCDQLYCSAPSARPSPNKFCHNMCKIAAAS